MKKVLHRKSGKSINFVNTLKAVVLVLLAAFVIMGVFMACQERPADATSSFEDDFEKSKARGWAPEKSPFNGKWTVESGYYHQTDASVKDTWSLIDVSSEWTDYKARLTVTPDTFDTSDGESSMNIIVKYQNPDNMVQVQILQDKYCIQKKVNGNFTTIAEKTRDDSEPFVENQPYKVKVVADGDMIELYVDEEKKLHAVDRTFSNGKFGVGTSLASAKFDNVDVDEINNYVIFGDDFEDYKTDDWEKPSGNWNTSLVGEGRWFSQEDESAAKAVAYIPGTLTNNSIEADIARTSTTGALRLYLRYNHDESNGYYLEIDSTETEKVATIRIIKLENGAAAELRARDYYETVNANDLYHIKFIADDDFLEGYINDIKIIDCIDDAFSSGCAGVGTYGATARFDNILVRSVVKDKPFSDPYSDYSLLMPDFSDEFNTGTFPDSKWHVLDGWSKENNQKNNWTTAFENNASHVSIADGKLVLKSTYEPMHFHKDRRIYYKTGAIRSKNTVLHGYFEARIKAQEHSPGLVSTFWLKKNDDVDSDGEDDIITEIDILETGLMGSNNNILMHNAHVMRHPELPHSYITPPASGDENEYHDRKMSSALGEPGYSTPNDCYHTYACIWNEEEIIWFVDGKIVRLTDSAMSGVAAGWIDPEIYGQRARRRPNNYWNTQALFMWLTARVGPPIRQSPAPIPDSYMYVDYVRGWKHN